MRAARELRAKWWPAFGPPPARSLSLGTCLAGPVLGFSIVADPAAPCCVSWARLRRLRAGEFTHAWTALTTILRAEGRRGIFAGYGSFLLRDLPFDAIEFFAYEAAKST